MVEEPAVTPTGGWADPAQVAWYTGRTGKLDARRAGEAMLVDNLPTAPERVLDLGCGDGRLAALVLEARPTVRSVIATDRSEPMLALARDRFGGDRRVAVDQHDLRDPMGLEGPFDVIVSGFAIHHVEHQRKQTLLREIRGLLSPGGVFFNLEVVRSATPRRHQEFLAAIGRTVDDSEDRLAPVDEQLDWMRAAGLVEVDCLWRWRGFALLSGEARTS